MTELIVNQSIEIEASSSKVWDVLTKAELTERWVKNFGIDGKIVSDWQLGSLVQWQGNDGFVYVEGNVTALDPGKMVRFTVFDTRSERPPISEEDGITYRLSDIDGHMLLTIRQGDFGKMPDGEKYYLATVEIWAKVLPQLKALAET